MPARAPCRALSVVLILLSAPPPAARACPHPCACYVPSEVHCTFRSLASVPAGISKHVERINLGFNSIQALSETSFAGLSKLELLMLHGNNIPSVPDGALRDLGSLQVFKFSYNKLRVITAQTLQGLRSLLRLHVDHNEIEFIHPHAFQGLTALRLLHLEGNVLHQLHSGTFSTFSFLDYFRLSNIRHLYLADNRLRSLPAGMLQNMPLLENLYLHGNPWSCDCDMRWFLEWHGKSKGLLKCKKDKAYEGGQLCPACASPRRLQKHDIHTLEDVPCVKPSITSPLRHNGSSGLEDEQGPDDDGGAWPPLEHFQVPAWQVSLNMTDEHGNTVSLACGIQKPTQLSQIRLNHTESQDIELNATVGLDFECPMTRENYEKLWKLIAYYSEVPVRLQREAALGPEPALGHRYRQHADADALYYTGVRAQLSCNVKASESPAISWVLPDGSVLTAPTEDHGGRFSILTSGWLKITSMRRSDSGLYQCVAQVRDETDRIVYRVLVQPPVTQPPDGETVTLQRDAGEALTLPCDALATPEAQVSWILPNGKMISDSANSSHAYVLANGTLSIPKVQPGDGGYYRCVAVNPLGADHFAVAVSVRKKGPGRSSAKRGRRPGGKTASRPRDVVEDEGGSADDAISASRLHPKDQETFVMTKEEATVGGHKAKKGRRKLKGWKTPLKEADTGVAEGRRVFESRRKIHMANKQITPERWADILARVRGKTLPRATGGPDVVAAAATPPSLGPGANPVLPAVPPPLVTPAQTAASAEESSADASLFAEEEQGFSPVPTTRGGPGRGRDRVILAGAQGTSRDPEVFIDDVFPEKDEDATWANVDSLWAPATTRMSVPYESYSALSTVVTAYEGPTRANAGAEARSPTDAASPPAPVSREDASPSDLSSLAASEAVPPVHAESELKSQPDEHETKGPSPRHSTPILTLSAVDSGTPEPVEDVSLGDWQVPAETHLQEQTDNLWLEKNGFRTQDNARRTKGTENNSLGVREGGEPGADAAPSRSPDTERPGVVSTALTDSSRGAKNTMLGPQDSALRPPVEKNTATVAVTVPTEKSPSPSPPATQPPRKRPNGRRKLRPHKFRPQDLQTPPATSAPADAAPARPTPAPAVTDIENDGGTNTDDDRTVHVAADADSVINVPSPSGSGASTVGAFTEESGFLGSRSWGTPRAAQPGALQTDTPAPASPETGTRPSVFTEWGDLDPPSEASPSAAASAPFQQEGRAAATAASSVNVESSSTVRPTAHPTAHPTVHPTVRPTAHPTAQSTVHRTVRPTVRPTAHPTAQSTVRPTLRPTVLPTLHPTATEQPASPFPHSALGSVAQATAKPTPLTSATPPATAGSREDVFFNHVGIPRTETPPGSYEGTPPTRRPPESSTPSTSLDALNLTPKELRKGASDGGTTNILPHGPHPQHQPGRVQTVHHAARVPDQPVPPRGTARPAHTTTRHPSRHSVTFQPPRHWTNKPQITAYPSRVWPEQNHLTTPKSLSVATAVVPWHGSRAGTPTDFPHRGTERAQGHSKVSADGRLPELTQPAGKTPRVGPHPSPDGRTPFFLNRTFSFPQWAATPKPPPATAPAPGTRPRIVHTGPYNRIHSQSVIHSVIHVDFGPPAPPAPHRPQGTVPPSTRVQNGPVLYSTRSPVPFATSSGQSSRSFHQSSSKFFSAGGPPASKFWTLGEKPQIVTKSPQTVSVAADTDVLLPCEATGKPTPFVTWTKVSTGALMTPNTRLQRFEVLKNGSFVIRRAQAQDGGRYLCTAKNLHGADRMLVQLSVAAQQPQIVAGHYQDVTVSLGDTIAMECLAKGTPVPHISWIFPDGRVWQAASRAQGRVTLHENRTLSIRDASFADRGVYKCVASNAAGADSLAIRLHVAALPPVIQQEKLENISLPPGLSVQVHCSAKAAPRASLRWVLADGTHVRPSQFVHGNLFVFPNGTLYIPRILWRLPSKRMIDALFSFDPRVRAFANGTLVVSSVTDKDAGDYLCVARNQVGDDFVVLQVHVVMKPAKIESKEEQDHRVFYGADLRVDCVASGLPDPEIVWGLPDGSLVHSFVQSDDGGGGRGQRYVVFNNGTLYFNEVGMREAGDYTCFAKNQVGRDEMTVHVKVVAEPAAIRNKTYAVVHVPYGDVVTVACEAKGEPTPKVTWLSPTNKPIPTSSEKYQIYEDGTLLIQKAQRSDSGNYTCVVRNSAGEDRKVVWVHVHVQSPKINGHPDAITTVREIAAGGSRKLIDCLAEGVPTPRARGRVSVWDNGTLTVREASVFDRGTYACQTDADSGPSAVSYAVIVIAYPPRITSEPTPVIYARPGHAVTMKCMAVGVPKAEITWELPDRSQLTAGSQARLYGNRQLHPQGSLTIQQATRSDAGFYKCTAKNILGRDTKTTYIHVY
ncbi:matrix-remodeling-associated protein 5 [Pteropus alecto]|uniref:matrix-remodeling-associated protein 5 n=1 Tax=Pteropus alecto TaxID=9402 RepID=UPI000D538CCF|nr:matrix-remodeling-associated protein 5 [Pteropus alecto]